MNLLQADATSSISASHILIPGGFAGPGNLDATPMFVDLAGGDLHLLPSSPGVDEALDASAPATDLEGSPRVDLPGVGILGTLADMGAFECHP